MAKVLPTSERIKKARALIQKARDLPAPDDMGWMDFTYAANVKDILRQARDLVKFVQFMPNAEPAVKKEVEDLMSEISSAEREILHKS
ncbi:MAG TPA: hypothetical protein PK040_06910 [Anaerolineaceae bacterium]|nr:hypothetical protein [Anaerolineaceae bacterium]